MTASNRYQRIPKVLHPLLGKYLRQVSKRLPGFLTGFYLVGSLALDSFNERFSDIDFVGVISRRASRDDLESLQVIHRAVEKEYPRWKMEGSYFQEGDLGRVEGVEPFPSYHDGRLRIRELYKLFSIDWWELKNGGIALLGPPPQELAFTVDWDLLIERMRQNLNSYWAGWAYKPIRLAYLLTNWGIQWSVLGVLRQYYSFRENTITSKTGAGLYALEHLPPERRKIVQEAIDLREGGKESGYRSRIGRALEARDFLRFVIRVCNNKAA